MNLTQTSPPAVLPLDLSVVQDHLRVIDGGEDVLITGYMQAATEHVGGRFGLLGRSLITQTWDLKLRAFPTTGGPLKLPFPPLQSVQSIKWIDDKELEQTLVAADYSVEPGEFIGSVHMKPGISWPRNLSGDRYPVTVRFVAGFGDNPADIPMPIRQAMLLLIAHWYENRSEVEACELTQIPMASTALLSPYKVTELVL